MKTLREYINDKIFGIVELSGYNANPDDDKLTFCNDRELLMRMKIHEYNVWYSGDGDELLNFYTRKTNIDYNYEPFYDRNKRGYFWSISSTEDDIKRTHSGIVRNIVDALVNIINVPQIECAESEILSQILEDNDFEMVYKQEQMPLTLVEGWGAYKINWDFSMSEYPLLMYYKAENVDFCYKNGRIVAIIFKDFYIDKKGNKYLLVETRKRQGKDLHIDKEMFRVYGEDNVIEEADFEDVPTLKDIKPHIEIKNYKGFLATPVILFKDLEGIRYGRSLFEGKIDLCDDYDQCISQRSNSVRKSTPIEYFNTDFLERDPRTGMTIQPKVYDRKYLMYTGGKDANGASNANSPVEVTEPRLQFEQYDAEANTILTEILDGIMSPASLGIDVAKKDNANAQREKEKITVFTRNAIIGTEIKIIKKLCNELICAYELMHTNTITKFDYDVTVKYGEFADESYENKLAILSQALQMGAISPEMYMEKLYGKTLSKNDFEKELKFLEGERQAQQLMHTGGAPSMPDDEENGQPLQDIPPEVLEEMMNEEETDANGEVSGEPPLQG